MTGQLKGNRFAVLATDGFEQSELTEPMKALRDAGAYWVDRELVEDRRLLTSRSPKDLPHFCSGMVRLFAVSRDGGRRAAE